MPRKLFNEAGDEFEVPTDEELAAQKTAVEEATKKVENLTKDMDELKQFTGTPADLRERMKQLKAAKDAAEKKLEALEKKGQTIDEKTGDIVPHTPILTVEQIKLQQRQTAQEVLVENEIERVFLEMPSDKRELVRNKFNKLIAGEKLTIGAVKSFADEAYRAAVGSIHDIDPVRQATSNLNGSYPDFERKDDNFADSAQGKQEASMMGLHHAKPSKK